MSHYSDAMVAELRGFESPVTRPVVDAFANKYSLSVKSVVAKLRHLGIEYAKPESVARPQARRKIEIVRNIESLMGYDGDTYMGLDKAPMQALQQLESDIVQAVQIEIDSTESETSEVAEQPPEANETEAA